MHNVVGQAVVGPDLYGRTAELAGLWQGFTRGEHIHMLAPRRVGKTSLMLELRREPPPNWHVVYVDVEGAESPSDFVATVIAELASTPAYRSWLEAMPLGRTVGDFWAQLRGAEMSVPFLRVELKSALGNEWADAMDRLQARLAALPEGDRHLLIIVDELPVLIARMLRRDEGREDVELLLAKLRTWRQSPALRGNISTLLGGSIGLEGMLRREGLSALINDLVPFRLPSWERKTATAFLRELGNHHNFELRDDQIGQMLDLLADPVPYHVQLFFQGVHAKANGDAGILTEAHIAAVFADTLIGTSGTPHLDHYGTRLETALDADSYAVAQDILALSSEARGAAMSDIGKLAEGREALVRSVLDELELDGYVYQHDDRLSFRSNLLRTWWCKHRVGTGW